MFNRVYTVCIYSLQYTERGWLSRLPQDLATLSPPAASDGFLAKKAAGSVNYYITLLCHTIV